MTSPQPESTPTQWQEMDGWFTPKRFAALLGALLFLTFFNVFVGSETFFYRDFGVFTYPIAQYYRESFWRGELPLWNPLNYCGIPLLAQWNTSILYPPSLFYLVLPLSWSLGVFNLLHLFLAGMGMYFLARRWLGNNFAASVAGIIFAYNGLGVQMLMWISNLAAWAWMPWVVLLAERAWREGGGRLIVATALVSALQLLTGSPEVILLTWVFCGALWAGQFYRGVLPRGRMFGRIVTAGILAGAMSAIQLLPFMDLLKHSHRDVNFGDARWAMPLSGLGNFLEPLFHSYQSGHNMFVQYDQYWVASYYMGIGTILLALVALWRVRKGRVWLLTAAAVGSVLMALGQNGGLYTVIKTALPQLGFMRFPIKFVVLATFVLPLLAAYAVRWNQQEKDSPACKRNTFWIVASALLGMLAIILWQAWKFPMVSDNWPLTWHNTIMRAGFLILVPLLLLAMPRVRQRKMQLLVRMVLLLLLWTDIFTSAPQLIPTVDRPLIYDPGIIRADLIKDGVKMEGRPRNGEPRMMQTAAATDIVRFTNLSKPTDDYLCRRLSLVSNCNLLDAVPKIDGFYSLYLKEMAQILGLLYSYDAQNVDLKGLKDFLGVAHISATHGKENNALGWIDRRTFMPLTAMGQAPVFSNETNTLAGLASGDFNPRQQVYLPLEAKGIVTATNQPEAEIISETITAHNLKFIVTVPAPAMLTVAQGYYHPWHAYVDGKRVKLWRANYAFQALEVPAGNHEVRLIYEDTAFRLGAIISGIALLICAVMWFASKRINPPMPVAVPVQG